MTSSDAAAAERAVSWAHLVPDRDFSGTVHSVFAHACNIAVDGRLLTVHDAALAHTPTSVRVTGPGHAWWSPAVHTGALARRRDGVLRMGGHVLDLAGIPRWAPPLPPPPAAGMDRRLEDLAGHHRAHRRGEAVAPVPGLHCAVERLRELMMQPNLDHRALTEAADLLVGLGPGLTPSGDDVLVGVLAGLVRAGRNATAAAAAATVGQVAVARGPRTTDVSRHYLQLAAEGHFGQPLTELVDAVSGGAPPLQLRGRVEAMLAVGASSGADALLGVRIGLSAVARWHGKELNHTSQEKAA